MKVQINLLWSLESVSDRYYVTDEDYQIYDSETCDAVKIRHDSWDYRTVILKTSAGSSKIIFYHKILALAFINNGPYELIEHLDDDPTNNDLSNLMFSNHSLNGLRAFQNGKHVHKSSKFEFCLEDGTIYRGTIREISKESGIPEGTLYDRIYTNRPCISNRTKYRFKYIKEIEYGTTRRYNANHGKLNTTSLSE